MLAFVFNPLQHCSEYQVYPNILPLWFLGKVKKSDQLGVVSMESECRVRQTTMLHQNEITWHKKVEEGSFVVVVVVVVVSIERRLLDQDAELNET